MPFLMPRSKTLSPWQRNEPQEEGSKLRKSTQKFATSPRIEFFFCIKTVRFICPKLSLPISFPILYSIYIYTIAIVHICILLLYIYIYIYIYTIVLYIYIYILLLYIYITIVYICIYV